MIDTLIYDALTKSNLSNFLHSDNNWRVYPSGQLGAAGIPARPDYPYLQHGDGGSNVVAAVKNERLTLVMLYDIFAYDTPGSFLRIKTILDLVKDNVEGISGAVASNGWRVTSAEFRSYGDDGYDPVNRQSSKRATFTIIASRPNPS